MHWALSLFIEFCLFESTDILITYYSIIMCGSKIYFAQLCGQALTEGIIFNFSLKVGYYTNMSFKITS